MPKNYRTQRLDRHEARKRVAYIVKKKPPSVVISEHARKEAAKDGMTSTDIQNVLLSPASKILSDGEFERGSYRYRLETDFMIVVIAFWEDGEGLNVVTTWDNRKRK